MSDAIHVNPAKVVGSVCPIEIALAASGVEFRCDVALSEFTFLRTGGRAEILIFPSSHKQLAEVLRLLSRDGVPFKIVGNTTNLLFLDEARYRCLISMSKLTRMELIGDGEIYAEAGVAVPDLARFALAHSLAGMEGLEGIPGTLGGAIFMNAGAYGSEIRDFLESVEVVSNDGLTERYSVEDAGLVHRSSVFRKSASNQVVYACRFKLPKGDAKKIYARMEIFHAKRHRYQDFMFPNLGSIFSGSPYRALARRDSLFGLAARLHFLLGYKLKVLGRESPINRKWLNDLAVKRFGLVFQRQPFSDKTINCLVNRGQGSTAMVAFIRELDQLMEGTVPLENEIVEGF